MNFVVEAFERASEALRPILWKSQWPRHRAARLIDTARELPTEPTVPIRVHPSLALAPVTLLQLPVIGTHCKAFRLSIKLSCDPHTVSYENMIYFIHHNVPLPVAPAPDNLVESLGGTPL